MALGHLFPGRMAHVTSSSNSVNRFEPMTDWVDATGIDRATFAWRNAGSTALYTRPAFQSAVVRTEKPDAWALLGTDAVSNDGEAVDGPWDMTGYLGGKKWVRFGFGHTANTGSFAQGDVFMTVSCDTWGTPVASRRFQVATDSTDKQVMAISAWLPAMHVDKAKLTVATLALANLYVQPVFQTATTLTSTANAWQTATSDWTPSVGTNSSDQETTTGEVAPNSLGTHMWVRFGIAYWLNGGTRGQADVSVSLSVRTA